MRPLDLDAHGTLPKLLALNAAQWGERVAVREKVLGIWKEHTWSDCFERVRRIACGLHALGVRRGEVVALIGQNRPDWVFAQIAAHACGALSLGIYKDSLAEEAAYLVRHADVKVVFCEDQEQVDKFIELGDTIPSLAHIVVDDERGMADYDDPRIVGIARLIDLGRAAEATTPALFTELVEATSPNDISMLCTTSGTTTNPKLVMLRSGPFLCHSRNGLLADPKTPDDEYVSVLPLPWVTEQVFAVAHFLLSGIKVNFVEEEETTAHDMREIGPSFLLSPPRVWESLAADIKARMMDAGRLKRALYEFGVKAGLAAEARGRSSWLCNVLVGAALRDRLGFSRLRSAQTGGAPLGADIFQFFRAIGVPLKQLYGQTEMAGVYAAHHSDDIDFETVGKPFDGVELLIDDPDRNGIGQVLARHPGMFVGYYRNDAATEQALQGGWMKTGDAGCISPAGHLVVLDRISDMATLSSGDRYSPQYLENKLKFSPYIGECVVLGREQVCALICIRYSTVSKWAEKRRIAFTTYSDLASMTTVVGLIRDEIAAINVRLPAALQIHRFLLLYKELDADDGELTRTRKVRRSVINERYAGLIDALHGRADAIDVDTTIALQDGRKTRIRATLPIASMEISR